ncbi:MAG: YegS/Rv2252/BmrU family lipid kinase [Chloroflexota bacterium]
MRPKRAFVIGRRRPGRKIDDAVAEVTRLLLAEGLKVEAAVVARKREVRNATSNAVKDGFDVVVAVGGDGAVVQVATSLARTDVPMAIVPTGTGNLLAGNLGIPNALREAAMTAIDGHRRTIDLGRVSIDGKKRVFVVACGIGFDADVMDRTGDKTKGRWGKLAYVASALLETPNIRDVTHRITIDGVRSRTDAAQVLIANFGRVTRGFRARGVRPDDGVLDVFIVQASGPLPALLAGWEALRSTAPGVTSDGRVFRTQARSVRIDTTPSRRVETDGSVVGRTPMKATIEPGSLVVMVPTGRRRQNGGDAR